MRFLFLFLFLSACGDEGISTQTPDVGIDVLGEDVSPYPAVSFESQIVPILRNSCILNGCHGERGLTTFLVPEGLAATSEDIKKGLDGVKAANGKLLIAPRQPSKSELLIRILADENSMPPLTDLPVKQKNDFNFWVAQGAQY